MARRTIKDRLYIAQAGRCCYCDEVMLPFGVISQARWSRLYGISRRQARARSASIEHLVRRADGGGNGVDNLALACTACNSKRQGMSWLMFATQRKREWLRWKDSIPANCHT